MWPNTDRKGTSLTNRRSDGVLKDAKTEYIEALPTTRLREENHEEN